MSDDAAIAEEDRIVEIVATVIWANLEDRKTVSREVLDALMICGYSVSPDKGRVGRLIKENRVLRALCEKQMRQIFELRDSLAAAQHLCQSLSRRAESPAGVT